jgi:hypothetical protein
VSLWVAIYAPWYVLPLAGETKTERCCSFAVATAGMVRYSTVDLGGLCFFSAKESLFSVLVLFVPRYVFGLSSNS